MTGDQKPSIAARTRGPWQTRRTKRSIRVFSEVTSAEVCQIQLSEFVSNERREADALLIADAPKMLGALIQIAIVCTDNMDADKNHRMALDFVRQIANDRIDMLEGKS